MSCSCWKAHYDNYLLAFVQQATKAVRRPGNEARYLLYNIYIANGQQNTTKDATDDLSGLIIAVEYPYLECNLCSSASCTLMYLFGMQFVLFNFLCVYIQSHYSVLQLANIHHTTDN